MTEARVVEIIGRPPNRYLGGDETYRVRDGGDLAEVWQGTAGDFNLVVIFKNKKVKAFAAATPMYAESYALEDRNHHAVQETPSENAGPGNAERVVNAISGAYLTWACPGVYRKPVLWMTAADVQLVQACNANGYMLFGMYFYMGGK
jgi:hypothetical protein